MLCVVWLLDLALDTNVACVSALALALAVDSPWDWDSTLDWVGARACGSFLGHTPVPNVIAPPLGPTCARRRL